MTKNIVFTLQSKEKREENGTEGNGVRATALHFMIKVAV
jgi:hypothetical protein